MSVSLRPLTGPGGIRIMYPIGVRPGEPPIEPEPEPEPPQITGNASPVQAPLSGGSTHMLPGNHFLGVDRVLVDNRDVPFFNVVSEHQIEFEVPEYTGGNTPPFGVVVMAFHPDFPPAQRPNTIIYIAGVEE